REVFPDAQSDPTHPVHTAYSAATQMQDPVGEPSTQWTDVWKVKIQDQPSDPDPGTAQPEVNIDADTSIFTRKTKAFATPRVEAVLAAIWIGNDLSPEETRIVQELIKEYADCFALSMGEVYHVPGAV